MSVDHSDFPNVLYSLQILFRTQGCVAVYWLNQVLRRRLNAKLLMVPPVVGLLFTSKAVCQLCQEQNFSFA